MTAPWCNKRNAHVEYFRCSMKLYRITAAVYHRKNQGYIIVYIYIKLHNLRILRIPPKSFAGNGLWGINGDFHKWGIPKIQNGWFIEEKSYWNGWFGVLWGTAISGNLHLRSTMSQCLCRWVKPIMSFVQGLKIHEYINVSALWVFIRLPGFGTISVFPSLGNFECEMSQ